MAKKSLNELLADKSRAHVFDLLRLSNYERNKVLGELTKLQQDLMKELIDAGITGEQGMTDFQRKRLEQLFVNTDGIINTAYNGIAGHLHTEMTDLAATEAKWASKAVNKEVKISLLDNFITERQAAIIASETLVQGAPSSEWWSRQADQTVKDFKDNMRQGMLRGETLQDLTRRVMGGTKAGKDVPGIPDLMGKPKRNAEALVRSTVMAVASETKRQLYAGNEDVVKGMEQLSTLDGRTTQLCMAYSGATWDLDGNPTGTNKLPYGTGTPRHWGCRSVEVPLLKSFEEITGIEGLEEIPDSTRASMDGQVPADTTFDEWLTKKDEENPGFADEMLGVGKANLWRSGALTLQDLVNDQGTAKTLGELKTDLGLNGSEASSAPADVSFAPPAEGTKTRVIWDLADEIAASGKAVIRKEVIAKAIAMGVNPATAATQFARWRAEQGTGGIKPPVPPVVPPAVATVETASFLDSEEYKAKLAALTPAQRDALKEYTLSDYEELNAYLRGQKLQPPAIARAKQALAPLDTIMAKDDFVVDRPLILHRGLSNPDDYLVRTDAAKLVGATFTDGAFVSTTTGKVDPYFATKATVEIHIPAGVRGVYVDSLSGNAGEREFLLNRGIAFDVVKVAVDDKGHRTITLQAKPPASTTTALPPAPTPVAPPPALVEKSVAELYTEATKLWKEESAQIKALQKELEATAYTRAHWKSEAELIAAENRAYAIRDELAARSSLLTTALFKQLAVSDPLTFNTAEIEGTDAQVKFATETLNRISTLLSKKITSVPDSTITPVIMFDTQTGRAQYEGRSKQITLTNTQPGELAHELGHFLEDPAFFDWYGDKSILASNSNAFLAYRTAGEKPERLKDLYPASNYALDEMTRKDKFPDPYMGKINPPHTEVTSLLLQYLIEKPHLLMEDQDMFTLLVSNLRGEKWSPSSATTPPTTATPVVIPTVLRPKPGTASATVWDLADEASKGGKAPTQKEIVEIAVKAGINPATAATQFGRWRRAQLTGDPTKEVTTEITDTKREEARKAVWDARNAEAAAQRAIDEAKAKAEAAKEAERLAALAEAEMKRKEEEQQKKIDDLYAKIVQQVSEKSSRIAEIEKLRKEQLEVLKVAPASEQNRLWLERHALLEEQDELEAEVKTVVQDMLRLPKAEQAKPYNIAMTAARGAKDNFDFGKKIQPVMDDLFTFIPAKILPDKEFYAQFYYDAKEDRATYSSATQEITLGPRHLATLADYGGSTIFHEAGHWLEYESNKSKVVDPTTGFQKTVYTARQNAQDFLAYRTEGEKAQKLSKLTGNSSYKADEVAKPDKFPDPYMGKIYKHTSSETTSMAIQYLRENPNVFVKDKELFGFLYCQLRGLKWSKPK